MLPLRDTIESKNFPIVNYILIGLNILFYLIELTQGDMLGKFFYIYGLVPARYSIDEIGQYFTFSQQVFSFFSFMFLHGGFMHLIGNVWFLYIFGDNIEDHLGHLRYLLFYLLCGISSGLIHLIFNFNSNIPTIGASGAIAGVMGAYLILYPKSRILTLIPIIFIPYFVEIPAYFFLGFWFVLQFFNATISGGAGSGIAWWAHIGGFVFGILILKFFDLLPSTGANKKLSRATVKKKTPKLHIIRPSGHGSDPNLYGSIIIKPYESTAGAMKLINIPMGFKKRLFRVTIPPGVTDGTVLKLSGLGKMMPNGITGDMFLKIMISE